MRGEYPTWVVFENPRLCVRSGHGHREDREALPGTDLCGPCHGRFPRILGDLVRYWQPLHDAEIRRPTRDYSRDRVAGGGKADVAAQWNPAAKAVITELTDWVQYLCRTIARESPTACTAFEPAYAGRIDVAVAALARWHARWLTHYPTLGPSWLADALVLREKAMRAVDPQAPTFKRVRIRGRTCTDEIEETEWGPVICGGELVGLLRTDGERPSVIVCSVNPNHTRLERKDWIHAAS